MNRKEAKEEFKTNQRSISYGEVGLDENDFNYIIDNIYNDFESRTCNNCEYWHQEYLCLEIGNGTFKTGSDFGCTFFKKKEI